MNESNIFCVSARAIMAFVIAVCCCGLAVWLKDINVLKDLSLLALGYYFGQKQIPNGENGGVK